MPQGWRTLGARLLQAAPVMLLFPRTPLGRPQGTGGLMAGTGIVSAARAKGNGGCELAHDLYRDADWCREALGPGQVLATRGRRLAAKELGRLGEDCAARLLEDLGYAVVERNWRCPAGEVDIVAEDGDETVLVEVKSRDERARRGTVAPELAVDGAKQEKYRHLARVYAAGHDVAGLRFDGVAVSLRQDGGGWIRHIPNAFAGDER